jgi:uncharacterized membrane protein HdeD (DUF308 family)
MDGLFSFLASRNGRITRIVAGVILIVVGLAIGFQTDSIIGWIITVIGIAPLAAGVFDFCLFAPFFRFPFRGPDLREQLGAPPPPPPPSEATE